MKKIFQSLLYILLLSILGSNLFAEINVISPCEGTWSNKQALVIDTRGKGEYFYSLNNTDPSAFGFAYDGPVLIDLKDDVTVRIVQVENGTTKDTKIINYKVNQNPATNKSYKNFVGSFYDSGILNYTAGTKIDIPGELVYSIGKSIDSQTFLKARTLQLSEECILSNYIPCIIKDEKTQNQWRFIIRTLPLFAGIYSRRDVPFYITNWDTITFTNDAYIYKIDTDFWGLPKDSVKVDRSVSHMISWQSINFEAGNPVEYYVLPVKPQIKTRYNDDGALVFYLEGDTSYSMGIKNNNYDDYQELFSEFAIDAFYGDLSRGNVNLDVYSNSVYQGTVPSYYFVDKYPPAKPIISSDAEAFYSNKPVNIQISSEIESDLYYAISEPFVIENVTTSYKREDDIFKKIETTRYMKAENNTVSLNLRTQNEGAVFFKISTYAKKDDYVSAVAEYSLIIDQYNFYYDRNFAANSDGSINAPFSNFEECIKAVNQRRRACIHLNSDVDIPAKQLTLSSNCIFKPNKENAVISFAPGSSIIVKSSTLDIGDCQFKMSGFNSPKNKTVVPVFKLEKSVLSINNCNGNFEFGKTGTLIDASSSSVSIADSIIHVDAQSYVSGISSVNAKVNIKDSVFNATADTAVILSLNGGDINIKNNSFKVAGAMGRVAELFSVGGIADSNKFQTELSRNDNEAYPIFFDKKSTFKDVNNVGNGF